MQSQAGYLSWLEHNSNCETRVLNKFNTHGLKQFKSLVILIVIILAHI